MPDDLPLLTLRQYAAAVGRSPRTIRRWIDAGALTPAKKLPGPTGAYLLHPPAGRKTRPAA